MGATVHDRAVKSNAYGAYTSSDVSYFCFVLLTYGNWQLYIAVTVLILFVGMWSVPHAERALGPRADWRGISRSRDQNQIVIDEVVGMLIACSPIFIVAPERIYGPIMLAFAAFRIFDIVKPLGIRVTRIGMGIPMGSSVEYVDLSTLTMSMTSRREL